MNEYRFGVGLKVAILFAVQQTVMTRLSGDIRTIVRYGLCVAVAAAMAMGAYFALLAQRVSVSHDFLQVMSLAALARGGAVVSSPLEPVEDDASGWVVASKHVPSAADAVRIQPADRRPPGLLYRC